MLKIQNKRKESQDPVQCPPSVSLPIPQVDCPPKIYGFLVTYILTASPANGSIQNFIASTALFCVA